MGVSPSRIIYANPCKASSFVRRAAAQNICLTTFDNVDELYKMKRFHPESKLVVRILTDDSKSVCQLGIKFGAPLADVPPLLSKARERDLVDVVLANMLALAASILRRTAMLCIVRAKPLTWVVSMATHLTC